LRIIESKGPPG